jgi:uncharacterized protein YkwD
MLRRPRRLCLLAALCVLGAFAVAPADAARSTHASAGSASAAVDNGVLEQLNQIRMAHHLVPLTLSPNLSAAAALHSHDMLAKGFFDHNSGDGQVFWKRIQAFYPEAGFRYWSVGENLFWTTGSASATVSMEAWMASPEHRANILNPGWRQIGISSITSADAPGTYGNTEATVITTDFGVRR